MAFRTLLIYNPTAGPWDMTRVLKRLAEDLGANGWQLELVETHKSGDAMWLSRQATRDGLDLVLVAGGDGTINEAANGLVGSNTILGIVPVGTGNILAHQMHMPILSPVPPYQAGEVADSLLRSRVQRVDAGVINGRYFVCWAGAGLDAEIAAQLEPRPRYAKRLRTLPYIIAAFSVASWFKGFRTRVSVEGRAFNTRALLIVASNIQLYAAFFTIARHAYMDDGMLDIFVFKGLGLDYVLRHFLHMLIGQRHLNDPAVIQVLARRIHLETTPSVAVHLDGDPFGETPAIIGLEAGVLRFLTPPQAPGDLFCKPPEQVL
ncbi:MAG: diacylglycerol kinase family lipid kinase [Anaerolineae bacterium]|nr:diacylglycerol kinase family lipid kinase [Anaerolineae bacterium]